MTRGQLFTRMRSDPPHQGAGEREERAMSESTKQKESGLWVVKPIGAYRIGGLILLFTDEPKGWAFWERVGSMEKPVRRLIMEQLFADVDPHDLRSFNARPDGRPGSILMMPVEKTGLPLDWPEHALVAIGNKHAQETLDGVPEFESGL